MDYYKAIIYSQVGTQPNIYQFGLNRGARAYCNISRVMVDDYKVYGCLGRYVNQIRIEGDRNFLQLRDDNQGLLDSVCMQGANLNCRDILHKQSCSRLKA